MRLLSWLLGPAKPKPQGFLDSIIERNTCPDGGYHHLHREDFTEPLTGSHEGCGLIYQMWHCCKCGVAWDTRRGENPPPPMPSLALDPDRRIKGV